MATKPINSKGKKSTPEMQSKSAIVPDALLKRIKDFAKSKQLIYDAQVARALGVNIVTYKNIKSGQCSPKTIERLNQLLAA